MGLIICNKREKRMKLIHTSLSILYIDCFEKHNLSTKDQMAETKAAKAYGRSFRVDLNVQPASGIWLWLFQVLRPG
jgi:hypothetical protein